MDSFDNMYQPSEDADGVTGPVRSENCESHQSNRPEPGATIAQAYRSAMNMFDSQHVAMSQRRRPPDNGPSVDESAGTSNPVALVATVSRIMASPDASRRNEIAPDPKHPTENGNVEPRRLNVFAPARTKRFQAALKVIAGRSDSSQDLSESNDESVADSSESDESGDDRLDVRSALLRRYHFA